MIDFITIYISQPLCKTIMFLTKPFYKLYRYAEHCYNTNDANLKCKDYLNSFNN